MSKYYLITAVLIMMTHLVTASELPCTNELVRSYKIIELISPKGSSLNQYVSHINQQGQVTGSIGFDSKNHFFLWDEKKGFTFTESNLRSFSPGIQPYINNHGIISSMPINDKGDKYTVEGTDSLYPNVKNPNKLKKNDIVIEKSLKWLPYNFAVNNTDQIIGTVELSNGRITPVIFNEVNKKITYIMPQQFKYNAYAIALNDRGWAIASYQNFEGKTHGILWIPEFGYQIIPNFSPSAINNSGVIAGSTENKAALWIRGQIIDLTKELRVDSDPATSISTIQKLLDINDAGQIGGWGTGGERHTGSQAIFITPTVQLLPCSEINESKLKEKEL